MKLRSITSLLGLVVCSLVFASGFTPVKNGKPKSRILASGDKESVTAALLLQNFVKKISNAELPIETSHTAKARKGDIVISSDSTGALAEDAFTIKCDNAGLTITGGPDKGAIYGVVTLLDDYMGVDYYGANEYRLERNSTITLPDISKTETPAFRYRQSQSYALSRDSVYRMWMRLEEPRDEFAGSMWVHTFERILPSAVYGKSHPEYYSFINGARRPGAASQWCLTNPELFELVAAKTDSIFAANPGLDMISISQNDGNNTYCQCEACKAVMEEEGAPSGNFIRFLNKLAARRPDKQFSTLAYLFSMQPPTKVKPLPNVNIMLCDIDAMREVPLTDNPSGRDFVRAIDGWSKISDNIFVWDYGINFDNYLAPFPNFPVLQPNIKLFKDHNAKMHFSQVAGSYGGDFSELRTYIVSKLMWNPDADVDSLMRDFMEGYYGDAAQYLYDYEKLLEGALLASHVNLWIYDSPVSHKDGMLSKPLIKRYNELFDKAEMAVANDPVKLDRVRRQRLSLQYSELEIARGEGRSAEPQIGELLDLFESRVKEYGVPTLNERNNSPVDYCELYRTRYRNVDNKNLAAGAKVEWITPPTGRYAKGGDKALTDGIYGGTTFVESWVGWESNDGEFIVDLGSVKPVSSVEGDFLHQLGQWIFLPRSIEVSVSTDNDKYTEFGRATYPEDRDPKVKFQKIGVKKDAPVDARYVKLKIAGVPICPSWHYGVGSPGWFFLDEVLVH